MSAAQNWANIDAGRATDVPDTPGAFLAAVRRFLDTALTPDLQAAGRATTGVHSDIAACRVWYARLSAQGWIAPSWPKAYGGTGWSAEQRLLFDRECAARDAPILSASGIRALGPLLIAMGSAAQKARYLPAILSGADLWCQGFSEAEAGSDLAALSMRAERAGDSYRITGRKLWTTGAHHSNRMFALVRTARGQKPQEGMTFLLIDMDSPGLAVRPIVTIDGEHEFNAVEFDDVAVPVENRVGAEDDGWAVAKRLMQFARGNNTTSAHLRRTLRRLKEFPATDASKLAEIEIALAAFEALEAVLLRAGRLAGNDEAASSLLKLQATELNQRMSEVIVDFAGPAAMSDTHHCMRRYLATRAASIYSGTNEIQRNLLSRHLNRG